MLEGYKLRCSRGRRHSRQWEQQVQRQGCEGTQQRSEVSSVCVWEPGKKKLERKSRLGLEGLRMSYTKFKLHPGHNGESLGFFN